MDEMKMRDAYEKTKAKYIRDWSDEENPIYGDELDAHYAGFQDGYSAVLQSPQVTALLEALAESTIYLDITACDMYDATELIECIENNKRALKPFILEEKQ